MRLDRITRKVWFEVGESEHALLFTLSGIEQLEAKMPGGFLSTIASQPTPTLTTLIDAFWIGLRGAGEKVGRQDAQAIVMAHMREFGVEETLRIYEAAVIACGFFGPTYTKELLAGLGIDDVDPGEDEAKNGKAAKPKK
ncbi:MAG: hypothetical protein SPI25_05245 [Dialister sp.]|nr:hypothetical protein [Dialister sp.]